MFALLYVEGLKVVAVAFDGTYMNQGTAKNLDWSSIYLGLKHGFLIHKMEA